MSREIKVTCDRCGKEVPEETGIQLRRENPYYSYSIDLCDECAELMYKFIGKETKKCSHS